MSAQTTPDNRRASRIFSAYAASVRATSADERRLKINICVDNISPGGLFVQIPYMLMQGTQLFTFVNTPRSVGLAAIGRIVRIENKGCGLTGIAVCFSQTRLLPLSAGQ